MSVYLLTYLYKSEPSTTRYKYIFQFANSSRTTKQHHCKHYVTWPTARVDRHWNLMHQKWPGPLAGACPTADWSRTMVKKRGPVSCWTRPCSKVHLMTSYKLTSGSVFGHVVISVWPWCVMPPHLMQISIWRYLHFQKFNVPAAAILNFHGKWIWHDPTWW